MESTTNAGVGHSSVMFPEGNEVGMRSLSVVIHLFGCSVLTYCFARRSSKENFFSWRGFSSIPFARWFVILVFFDSWLFLFLAGILINGVGLSLNEVSCQLGIFCCIVLYALSKVLIYFFLIEKVYIVWPNSGTTRWSSLTYRVCLGSMCGYAIIVALMVIGRIARMEDDGQCIIGLGKLSSLSLLVYDLLLNVFLTVMFINPLRRSKFLSERLRRVAQRTLAAATMALITSAVNIAVLTILHGEELGWVCLGSCGTDTTLNALVLFWVTSTSNDGEDASGPSGGPTTHISAGPYNAKAVGQEPSSSKNEVTLPSTPVRAKSMMNHPRPPSIGRPSGLATISSRSHPSMPISPQRTAQVDVKNLSPIGRFASALGLMRRSVDEDHGMNVRVTVTTRTDALEDAKCHSRSNSLSSTSQKRDSSQANVDVHQDLERGDFI